MKRPRRRWVVIIMKGLWGEGSVSFLGGETRGKGTTGES